MTAFLYDSFIKWTVMLTSFNRAFKSDYGSVLLSYIKYCSQFLKLALVVRMEMYFYGWVNFKKRPKNIIWELWCWCEILTFDYSYNNYPMFMHKLIREEENLWGDYGILLKNLVLTLPWIIKDHLHVCQWTPDFRLIF